MSPFPPDPATDPPPAPPPPPGPPGEREFDESSSEGFSARHLVGFIGGVCLLLAAFFAPPLFGLAPGASKVALLCFAMALLWVTEGLPISAVALLPVPLLPLLGVSTMREATAPYADPIIYLFMGGFMLSIAMERWNLHRRLALRIISVFGSRPRSLLLGFLVSSAFISMWVSNAATAMMMLPIGISVHGILKEKRGESGSREFGAALVLAIAYGANIGGLGTLIGTPPNAILKGYMEKTHGVEVGFAQWMKFGVPLVLISLPLVHLILTRISFRVDNTPTEGLGEALDLELKKLGRTTGPEWCVLAAFGGAVTAWISREGWKSALPGITDEVIAMTAACALFFIPVNFRKGIFVLDWKTSMKKMPWDVLVLFGGGLSLAAAFEKTKLAAAMAGSLQGMSSWPALAIVFLVTAIMIAATALTSNTATTAAFLPVIGSLAVGIDQPVLLLAIPVTMAASADFMLPVGTPPNAIAYGSGLVTLPRMIRAGLWVDLLFVALIPLLMWTVGRAAFGL